MGDTTVAREVRDFSFAVAAPEVRAGAAHGDTRPLESTARGLPWYERIFAPATTQVTLQGVDLDGDGQKDDDVYCAADRFQKVEGGQRFFISRVHCQGTLNMGQTDRQDVDLVHYDNRTRDAVASAVSVADYTGDGLPDVALVLNGDLTLRVGDRIATVRRLWGSGLAVFSNQTTVRTEEVTEELRPQASVSPGS